MYDGEVTRVVPYKGEDGNAGGVRVWVKSKNKDGEAVGYMHLKKSKVSVGDKVDGGDVLGTLGTSGNSATSGRNPHVHVQQTQNGKPVNPGIP